MVESKSLVTEELTMSEHTTDHAAQLAEAERANRLSIAWKQVTLWCCGGSLILLMGGLGALFYYYYLLLPPAAIAMIAALGAILFFLILAVAGNVLSLMVLLRRDSALMELRFDVYAAVESAFAQTLYRHLPNYTRLHTELDVGEELYRRAKQVSKRSSELTQKLQTIYAGKSLAEAVDLMVKDSLQAHGLAADNASVASFLETVSDNIVPIRHAGE